MKRRNFLIGGLAAAALVHPVTGSPLKTPYQTEGPFFPVSTQIESDVDLTRLKGSKERARGNVVLIRGRVVSLSGAPIPNAQVEIWQACASGRYNHPSDPNDSPLDPAFQYYGRVLTDKLGRYKFRTIKPGAYPATRSWMRPPHIHFKVRAAGYGELTTQMYFEGDPEIEKDSIYQAISPSQRKLVVVKFDAGSSTPTGDFKIILGHQGKYSHLVTPVMD